MAGHGGSIGGGSMTVSSSGTLSKLPRSLMSSRSSSLMYSSRPTGSLTSMPWLRRYWMRRW